MAKDNSGLGWSAVVVGDPGSGLVQTMASPADSGRVLLIGDIRTALLDAVHVNCYPCEVRTNILEGIDAAVRGRFAAVAVVMGGTTHQLGPALRALRKGTQARILLLAPMHEEPIARRLMAGPGDEKLADEYLVCPTCLATLCLHAGLDQGAEAGRHEAQEQGRSGISQGGSVRAEGLGDGSTAVGNHRQAALDDATVTVGSLPSPALVMDLEQKVRHLEWLATTDDLTGLKNRRYLWEFARQILEHARQTKGRVTLLVFDIDNFKHYNDVYGHLMGDEILRQAAILMRRCCRSHDVVGRIGGDEFAVVFWDDPNRMIGDIERERRAATAEHPSEVILVARRFQNEFGNADLHLLGPRGEGVVTISGGLASFPRDGTTVQQLFERADRALREAKGSGKNRIYLVGEPKSDIADIK
jgi:diguanylate cyclase (GGDEF)-like protein